MCVTDAGCGIWGLPASGRHYRFFLASGRHYLFFFGSART